MNSVTLASFVDELDKIANEQSGLKPSVQLHQHQEEAINKLVRQGGQLLLAHPVGSGKCVRGGTPVLTNRGLLAIETLFGTRREGPEDELTLPADGLQVLSYRDGAFRWTPVRTLYRQRLRSSETTIGIGTLRGGMVDITRQHPLPIVRGGAAVWVAAGYVQEGDFAVVPRSIEEPIDPYEVDDDILALMSWQITEGHEQPNNGSCCITQDNLPLLHDLKERLHRVVPRGTTGSVCPAKMSRKGVMKTPYLRFSSVEYRRLLESLGYTWGRLSSAKAFPAWFLQLSNRQLRDALRIVFDAEGSVGEGSVELTTKSPELAIQIQYALLRFGVRASLHSKTGMATNGTRIRRTYWRLSFSGEDAEAFLQVGFATDYKQRALALVASRTRNPNFGIPVRHILDQLTDAGFTWETLQLTRKSDLQTLSTDSCWQLINRLKFLSSPDGVQRYEQAAAKLRGTAGSYSARTLQCLKESRALLTECVRKLQALLDPAVRYELVTLVDESARGGFVYDLEVDSDEYDEKNYVAGVGGLLLHNTITSIAGFERLRGLGLADRALVVTPASLRANYLENGIQKFTAAKGAVFGNSQEVAAGTHVSLERPDPHARYHVVSYDMFRKDPIQYVRAAGADTVIYDELHKAKNEGVLTTEAIKQARPHHRNFIGMTGSIVSNTPADLVPLVDAMTDGKHVLGSKSAFESRFVKMDDQGNKVLHNPQVLRSLIAPYIHYVAPEDVQKNQPKKVVETVSVEMSPHQAALYKFIVKKLDPITALKYRLNSSSLNGAEVNDLFSKIIRMRQLSNSVHTIDKNVSVERSAIETPKIKRLLDDVEEHLGETSDGQVVIHTNLIHGGVDVLQAGLKQRGIDHAVFIGKGNEGVTEGARQQGVQDFRAGKKKVIVISAAGSEGLDLPNTTMMAMLDGHFNPERINQAEARGIRAGGLSHRAPEDRNVVVRRYVSVLPSTSKERLSEIAAGIWDNISPSAILHRLQDPSAPVFYNPFHKDKSPDQWVYGVAHSKEQLNKALHSTVKTGSVQRAMGGAAIGALYGALLPIEQPKSKRQREEDPGYGIRRRIGSILGGAAGGAGLGAVTSGITHGIPNIGALYTPVLGAVFGPHAGQGLMDVAFAPVSKVPDELRSIVGDQQNIREKDLFNKYWERFGGELERDGTDAALDPVDEKKFVDGLRAFYERAKRPEANTDGAKRFSKARIAMSGLIGGGLMTALPAIATRSPAAALSGLPAAALVAVGSGKLYRAHHVDPRYEVQRSGARTRSNFTDEQLRDLLRGKTVEEVKTKQHVIK